MALVFWRFGGYRRAFGPILGQVVSASFAFDGRGHVMRMLGLESPLEVGGCH